MLAIDKLYDTPNFRRSKITTQVTRVGNDVCFLLVIRIP
jgi:hypothetical protein